MVVVPTYVRVFMYICTFNNTTFSHKCSKDANIRVVVAAQFFSPQYRLAAVILSYLTIREKYNPGKRRGVFPDMVKNYTIKILGSDPVDENVMPVLIVAGMVFLLCFISKLIYNTHLHETFILFLVKIVCLVVLYFNALSGKKV